MDNQLKIGKTICLYFISMINAATMNLKIKID